MSQLGLPLLVRLTTKGLRGYDHTIKHSWQIKGHSETRLRPQYNSFDKYGSRWDGTHTEEDHRSFNMELDGMEPIC